MKEFENKIKSILIFKINFIIAIRFTLGIMPNIKIFKTDPRAKPQFSIRSIYLRVSRQTRTCLDKVILLFYSLIFDSVFDSTLFRESSDS